MDRRAEDAMRMPKVGEVVEMELMDHDQEDDIHYVTLYGRVAIVSEDVVVVDMWHGTQPSEDSREKQSRNNALDRYAVVRKAILDWWPLSRRRS
jgi:hypothetical protein